MDAKTQAEFDQSAAIISDTYPPMWRRLYTNLLAEGFTEEQSWNLLQTFIMSMAGARTNGTMPNPAD